jgi:hypothetical protein
MIRTVVRRGLSPKMMRRVRDKGIEESIC